MKHRTLLPDAGEVVLDQLMVEGSCRLVMVLRAGRVVVQVAGISHGGFTAAYKRRLKDLPWEGIPVDALAASEKLGTRIRNRFLFSAAASRCARRFRMILRKR